MITLHIELMKHRWAYTILVIGMMIATLLFMAAWPSHFWQRVVGVAAAVFYAVWELSLIGKLITFLKKLSMNM